MSDDLKLFLAEKVIEKQKEKIAALKTVLHSISLGSQNSMTTKEDLGAEARRALAALVGEEKKYSRDTCPKNDTWFANGGACGKAWNCRECKDAPDALVGEE